MADLDKLADDLILVVHSIIDTKLAIQPKMVPGSIVPGSWKPGTSTTPPTVSVRLGRSLAIDDDGVSSPLNLINNVPLLASGLGHEYGPRGYESVVLIPVAGGYRALLEHDEATSPGAKSGEMHVGTHYSPQGMIDGFLRFVNDAFSANDGMVSLVALVGALCSIATAAGLVFVMRDDLQRVWIGAENLDDELDAVATVRYLREYVDAKYNSHTHPVMGVMPGSGTVISSAPEQQMQSQGSQTVKAAQ
jgi:hypothetical protein